MSEEQKHGGYRQGAGRKTKYEKTTVIDDVTLYCRKLTFIERQVFLTLLVHS
jgi:hypothetical protein